MRYLLDTHTFIWWDQKSATLSPRARALFHDTAAELLLSIVSVWEIQIKLVIGKLVLPAPCAVLSDWELDDVHKTISATQITTIARVRLCTIGCIFCDPLHPKPDLLVW